MLLNSRLFEHVENQCAADHGPLFPVKPERDQPSFYHLDRFKRQANRELRAFGLAFVGHGPRQWIHNVVALLIHCLLESESTPIRAARYKKNGRLKPPVPSRGYLEMVPVVRG